MVTHSTRPAAAAAPTCRRCRDRHWVYLEGGPGQFPFQVDCPECSDPGDDDAPDDDAGMWNDDIAASSPDDASRWAAVAFHYPAA